MIFVRYAAQSTRITADTECVTIVITHSLIDIVISGMKSIFSFHFFYYKDAYKEKHLITFILFYTLKQKIYMENK